MKIKHFIFKIYNFISFRFSLQPLFYKWWYFDLTFLRIHFSGLLWKWKYEFVRVERVPSLEITILNCELTWYFGSDMYWENKLSLKHGKTEEWRSE